MDYVIDEVSSELDNIRDKKIVLVGGAFDLLHIGHVKFLYKSKGYGDILVVHVLGDKTVMKYKGTSRPMIPEYQRAFMLNSLKCVDYVFIHNLDTLQFEILDKIKPDKVVRIKREKGHIYYEGNVFFEKRLKEQRPQIEIVYTAESPGPTTTGLIKKIKETKEDKSPRKIEIDDLIYPKNDS